MAVFFDIEKAYDMMWGKGLLIRLGKLGVKGRIYRWIQDFLLGRVIQVRIGKLFRKVWYRKWNASREYSKPVIILHNDKLCIYGNRDSLFADDGAIWKRGEKI